MARVHPLELTLVAALRRNPGAGFDAILTGTRDERIAVYAWLFRTRNKDAQDRRIQTILEEEAFFEIHRSWARSGYPFDSLVPSLATALGSSADRPTALAELMGILQDEGRRRPTRRLDHLRFAEETPYETLVEPAPTEPRQVLAPEVAVALRALLVETVERGTAVRARGTLITSDGRALEVGGKTGTGDHRFRVYGSGGRLVREKILNRSATFAFTIGDRFHGVATAFVPGPEAAGYRFTSSLAVQLVRVVGPDLMPLLERSLPAGSGTAAGDRLRGPASEPVEVPPPVAEPDDADLVHVELAVPEAIVPERVDTWL